jgi:hypothetical protein
MPEYLRDSRRLSYNQSNNAGWIQRPGDNMSSLFCEVSKPRMVWQDVTKNGEPSLPWQSLTDLTLATKF